MDKQPNPAHRALASLEERGLLRGVITQNIDRLHGAAGTRRLIEVHGSIEKSVCLECGGKQPLERVVELLGENPAEAPECPACIAPLKPDVVLFGELLPEEALAEAHALCADADLLLCVGSSLEVNPVAALPGITLRAGGQVALVTAGADALRRRRGGEAGRRRGGRAGRRAGGSAGRVIAEGEQAPDFTLPDQDGGEVTLSSLRGETVVLYFYPRANTPGCTTQACGIRDHAADYGPRASGCWASRPTR